MHKTQSSTHKYRIRQSMAACALATISCLANAGAPVNLTGALTWIKENYAVKDSGGINTIAQAWDFEYQDATDLVNPLIKGTVSKPSAGVAPYAGVVVSHGLSGNAAGFSTSKAPWFAPANYITVAVDYTHANISVCQTSTQCGGSAKNLGRAKKALDVLHSQQVIDKLGDIVNRDQTFLYGNSMGAMVTVEFAQTLGSTVDAAAITAGGIYEAGTKYAPLTPGGVAGVANMETPLMQLHGTADTTVLFSDAKKLSDALDTYGKVHQAQWRINGGHGIHSAESTGDFVLAWFDTYRNYAAPQINQVSKVTISSVNYLYVRGTGFGFNHLKKVDLVSGINQFKFNTTQVTPYEWGNELIRSVVPVNEPSGTVSVTAPVGPVEANQGIFEDPVGGKRSNLFSYTFP